MKKVNQWRFIIGISYMVIIVIIVIIGFLNLVLFGILSFIWGSVTFLFEFFIKPYLEKFETDEKRRKEEVDRYESIIEIIKLLEGYESIKSDEFVEIETTQRLGELFPKLQLIGFGLIQNSLKDNFFGVHVTNFPVIQQFLIRRLELGKDKRPEEAYFSQRYPQAIKDANVQVLNDFIKYLKKKIGKQK